MAYAEPSRAAIPFDFDTAYTEPSRSAVGIGFSEVVGSTGYVEPSRTAVGFNFEGAYTEPARSAIGFEFVGEGTQEQAQARAAAASMLGDGAAFGVLVPVVRSTVVGPLSEQVLIFGADPLRRSWVVSESPLGVSLAFALLVPHAQVVVDGPLGASLVEASLVPVGAVAVGSLLGTASATSSQQFAQILLASPLDAPVLRAFHDFSSSLPAGWPTYYVCDIEFGGNSTRLPISSWQATMQTDAACYVQAVIPAVGLYASLLTDALADGAAELVISRVARLADGAEVESELARAPLGDLRLDRGPTNYTATISGYADAINEAQADSLTRTLESVRSISSGLNDRRARAAIDWFMRPGQKAMLPDASELTASWVNYYVNAADAYMDVGERA